MIRRLFDRFVEWIVRPLEMFDVDPTGMEDDK